MSQERSSDVLVLGSGAAGLATALQLAESAHVQILSKDEIHGGSTNRAQGGIAAVLHPNDSIESHIADTIKAGDGLCDPAIVQFGRKKRNNGYRQFTSTGCRFRQVR